MCSVPDARATARKMDRHQRALRGTRSVRAADLAPASRRCHGRVACLGPRMWSRRRFRSMAPAEPRSARGGYRGRSARCGPGVARAASAMARATAARRARSARRGVLAPSRIPSDRGRRSSPPFRCSGSTPRTGTRSRRTSRSTFRGQPVAGSRPEPVDVARAGRVGGLRRWCRGRSDLPAVAQRCFRAEGDRTVLLNAGQQGCEHPQHRSFPRGLRRRASDRRDRARLDPQQRDASHRCAEPAGSAKVRC